MKKVVVLLVGLYRFFKLAWLGFGPHIAGFGRLTHAADILLERFIFDLPLHHGLLSFEGDVVEGVVGEVLIICQG